ncbi:MAG: DUF1254 domain-containing protein [Rhodoferax sp.]|nr:DUF1254 domain-containing protein [Rhodoferax sp.]
MNTRDTTAAATSPDSGTVPDPRVALGQAIGLSAGVWGYPLVETLRTCRLQTAPDSDGNTSSWRSAMDRLQHVRRAATDTDRDVVTPANDLLYTTGWINLANGPRLLHVPSSARHDSRYFVLALYDAWTDNFANPGLRTCDPAGETLLLVGPNTPTDPPWPAATRTLTAPTDLVWLIARIVVGDDADAPAARELQDAIRLEIPPGSDTGQRPLAVRQWAGPVEDTMAALAQRPQDAGPIAAAFFTNLCQGLVDAAVPPADRGLADWFGRARLQASRHFDWAQLDPPLRDGLTRGLQDAAALLTGASRSHLAKPWAFNLAMGRYGTNYLMRAAVAYKGLGGLTSDEAIYAMADFDADKQLLDGRRGYLMRFEPGELPPVDAFWSITLYAEDRFLHPNALHRFSIGDRTPGLLRDPDGGLTLRIGHAAPADTRNWLPAPAAGFYLILRMYMPRPDAARWRIPPLQRLMND